MVPTKKEGPMTRFLHLRATLALLAVAPPCLAEPPDAELARLRAEVARLRQENAALKKQFEALAPPQSDFTGVLRERSVTLQIPPQVSGIGPFRQEKRLVVDLGKSLVYDLAFKSREEEQKARSWVGKKVVVRGSVQTFPDNPWAREVMFPPPPPGFSVPARFSTFTPPLAPPRRWVLVVSGVRRTDGAK